VDEMGRTNRLQIVAFAVAALICVALAYIQPAYGEPPARIEVSVPDYVLTKRGGYDYVDIPGGNVLLANGSPRVPFYVVRVAYPKGCRVQSVKLKEKSGAKRVASLNLSTVVDVPLPGGKEQAGGGGGFYPSIDFTWRVFPRPDGSSELYIYVYAFKYDRSKMEAVFYKHWVFKVYYIFSHLSIVEVNQVRDVYEPGENATVFIGIKYGGSPADVVLGGVVKRYGTEEVVAATPLKMLHIDTSFSKVSLVFPTKDIPLGEYTLEIYVNSTDGLWLDKATISFIVGKVKLDVGRFDAYPRHFKPGETVTIVLEALNSGSRKVSGRCVFMIMRGKDLVEKIYQNFTGLAPGKAIKFKTKWNTSGAQGIFRIIAVVLYESQSTQFFDVQVESNYPPQAAIIYLPSPLGVGDAAIFNASESADPDGEIVSYSWSFGDGSKAEGVVVEHKYMRPGRYAVKLAVTDDKGASAEDTVVIEVHMKYWLNATTSTGRVFAETGWHLQGEEVVLRAPEAIPMKGLYGTLGGEYVFEKWEGAVNSTNREIKVRMEGYIPYVKVIAVYSENLNKVIMALALLGLAGAVILLSIIYIVKRRKEKGK